MENPYDFADIMKKYMKITTYNKSYSDFFKELITISLVLLRTTKWLM